jgi:hypothetical protein
MSRSFGVTRGTLRNVHAARSIVQSASANASAALLLSSLASIVLQLQHTPIHHWRPSNKAHQELDQCGRCDHITCTWLHARCKQLPAAYSASWCQ